MDEKTFFKYVRKIQEMLDSGMTLADIDKYFQENSPEQCDENVE